MMTTCPPITIDGFRSLAVKAHVGGVGVAIAIFQAVLPYTYLSDCRANLGSREITELLAQIIAFFLIGILIAALPKLVACLRIAGGLASAALSPLVRRTTAALATRLASPWYQRACTRLHAFSANAVAWSNRPSVTPYFAPVETFMEWCERNYEYILSAISFGLFLLTALALYTGVIADFSRTKMVDQQRTLTESCGKAQGYTLDRNATNPWINVTPYQPPNPTEP